MRHRYAFYSALEIHYHTEKLYYFGYHMKHVVLQPLYVMLFPAKGVPKKRELAHDQYNGAVLVETF